MPTPSTDHRKHRRVEFFMVSNHQEHVPVWVFKPDDAADGVAGLVMNLSDGGLQVLTASDSVLEGRRHDLQLLLGEDDSVARFRGRVAHVWTRDGWGGGRLSGFRFEDDRSSAEDFIRTYRARASHRPWVRCLLTPAG